MCQHIYISSNKKLPEIAWNENSPGFYVSKEDHPETLEMLKPILNSNFIYKALSHMGCSCGLTYDQRKRRSENETESENHAQRIKDVRDFVSYLNLHKLGNKLQIFSTEWSEFPDEYHKKDFNTKHINEVEFYIEEMVVLDVV